ncbi:MAG: hypothetical protein H6669_01480 [Ardenticatenaceae bacterium]|nr:hypothetical protein [Ardenticatenaceae bacterium]
MWGNGDKIGNWGGGVVTPKAGIKHVSDAGAVGRGLAMVFGGFVVWDIGRSPTRIAHVTPARVARTAAPPSMLRGTPYSKGKNMQTPLFAIIRRHSQIRFRPGHHLRFPGSGNR